MEFTTYPLQAPIDELADNIRGAPCAIALPVPNNPLLSECQTTRASKDECSISVAFADDVLIVAQFADNGLLGHHLADLATDARRPHQLRLQDELPTSPISFLSVP
eukprot:3982853-Pyramimonas_sp.AAC.1